MEIRDAEARARLKMATGGQTAEAVPDDPVSGGAHVNRKLEAPRQNTDAANVIRMFMGDENGR